MLKPSKKSGGSSLLAEGKAHGAGPSKTSPNTVGSMRNRVLVDEAPGSKSAKRTFSAPRSDAGGGDATTRGYTKVG